MKIVIIGDYNPDYPPHPATTKSLEHIRDKHGYHMQIEWLGTEKLNKPFESVFSNADAIWLGPAPYVNNPGVRMALTYIRTKNLPFIGTCGGMYQAVAEFFISQMNFDETYVEYQDDVGNEHLFLSDSSCPAHGFKVVRFKTIENTKARTIYPTIDCEEDSNCGFIVNQRYHPLFAAHNFIISGVDTNQEAKIFELTANKFYVVTKFLPQMRSTPDQPHPMVEAFVKEGSA